MIRFLKNSFVVLALAIPFTLTLAAADRTTATDILQFGTATSYLKLQRPAAVGTNPTFTMPATDGTAGQALTTNGAGILTFATPTGATTFSDAAFRIYSAGDATKLLAFNVGSIATATTRTITWPNSNLNLSTTAGGDFANATLSNLGSTSINASLIPNADLARNIGGIGARFLTVHTSSVQAGATTLGLGSDTVIQVQSPNNYSGPWGVASGNTGNFYYRELAANGGNSVGFRAADSIPADVIWTLPSADGTSGQVLSTNGSGILSWASSSSGAPQWTKYTFSHTAFQTAGPANDVLIVNLSANQVVQAVVLKTSVAFAGTGFTDYILSVGEPSDDQEFIANISGFGAVSANNFAMSNTFGPQFSFGTTNQVRIYAASVGANLNQSTAGSVDVWVQTSTLP